MNYSIDITVATKRDLADAFDYIDGMLMNPSAAEPKGPPPRRGSRGSYGMQRHGSQVLLPVHTKAATGRRNPRLPNTVPSSRIRISPFVRRKKIYQKYWS